MKPLRELLAHYVRPRSEDELYTLIRRAELAARLIGAVLVASAAASTCPAGVARTLLNYLERPSIGNWSRAAGLSLGVLRSRGAALASFSSLISHAGERGVDRWVLDYESSLRHSERIPPPYAVRSIRDAIERELARLCSEVLLRCPDLIIVGDGGETQLESSTGRIAISPFLWREGEDLWLWDGKHKKRRDAGAWLRITDPVNPAPTSSLRPNYQQRFGVEWMEIGAASLLKQQIGQNPIAAFCGQTTNPFSAALVSKERAAFLTTHSDPVELAEKLAAAWRTTDRPVFVLEIGIEDDVVSRLHDLLRSESSDPINDLRNFCRMRQSQPVAIVTGAALSESAAVELETKLELCTQVLVLPRHRFLHCWSPELRRRWQVQDQCEDVAAEPFQVIFRRRLGTDAVSAWREALIETFGLTDTLAIGRLLDLLDGRRDLLETPELLESWQRGHLSIGDNGGVELVHRGWQAAIAGLRGGQLPPPPGHDGWRAGRELSVSYGRINP